MARHNKAGQNLDEGFIEELIAAGDQGNDEVKKNNVHA